MKTSEHIHKYDDIVHFLRFIIVVPLVFLCSKSRCSFMMTVSVQQQQVASKYFRAAETEV